MEIQPGARADAILNIYVRFFTTETDNAGKLPRMRLSCFTMAFTCKNKIRCCVVEESEKLTEANLKYHEKLVVCFYDLVKTTDVLMCELLHCFDLCTHTWQIISQPLLVHHFDCHFFTRQYMSAQLHFGKSTCNERKWSFENNYWYKVHMKTYCTITLLQLTTHSLSEPTAHSLS